MGNTLITKQKVLLFLYKNVKGEYISLGDFGSQYWPNDLNKYKKAAAAGKVLNPLVKQKLVKTGNWNGVRIFKISLMGTKFLQAEKLA